MKTPRFTDNDKFPPGGYRKAAETDIRKTFARIKAERQRILAEQEEKVEKLRSINIRVAKR